MPNLTDMGLVLCDGLDNNFGLTYFLSALILKHMR